eukprot:Seg3263.2 transcript_id=Seg3263.2/GoldUCD/mRNA.D3Y31 product="hypothetical protein" protein_id=Seg3263.2/GoldUCD/D3Y31
MDVESACVGLNNLIQEPNPRDKSGNEPSKDVEHTITKKVKLSREENNSKKKPILQQSKLETFLGVQKQTKEERSPKSDRGKPIIEMAKVLVFFMKNSPC